MTNSGLIRAALEIGRIPVRLSRAYGLRTRKLENKTSVATHFNELRTENNVFIVQS